MYFREIKMTGNSLTTGRVKASVGSSVPQFFCAPLNGSDTKLWRHYMLAAQNGSDTKLWRHYMLAAKMVATLNVSVTKW
jgi:hypothetical protein